MEVIRNAARRLLIVEPCPVSSQLLARMRSHGWSIKIVDRDTFSSDDGDVALVYAEGPASQCLGPLRLLLSDHRIEWVAVMDEVASSEQAVMRFVDDRAFDYQCLPIDDERLCRTLTQAAHMAAPYFSGGMGPLADSVALGNCRSIRELRKLLPKLLTDRTPIVVHGETGVGKELFARKLHELAGLDPASFVMFDVAMARNGAAGAPFVVSCEARFPSQGTLFVGNLPALMPGQQQALARFMGDEPASASATGLRVVVAIDELLPALLRQGRLDDALYQCLDGPHVHLPALRDRGADIRLLAEHFARRYCSELGLRPRRFSDEALSAMQGYGWPGNIWEMNNRVRRAVALAEGDRIELADLRLERSMVDDTLIGTLADYVQRAERQALNDAMRRYSKNMSQAARVLGISRPTFYRLLHKHHLR